MKPVETDVLIVGAGPCGLMLANELGRRGIRVILVDREATVATAPQANATQARTMEHYRRLGFADEIRALGMPDDHPTDVAYFTTFSGHELARHKMPASRDAATFLRQQAHVWNGAELPHRVPQSLVEQTLCRKAQGLPTVSIWFETELEGFAQDDTGVLANLRETTGRAYQIRARYLFGADGGSSTVRKQLGIRYSGGETRQRDFMGGNMLSIYLDAPAFYDLKIPRAWMYWTFNRKRRALLATVDGRGSFVLQTQLREGEDANRMSEAEAGALFLQAVGRDLPFTVTGIASWLAGRALVAETFLDGRVLLGGDAIHLFTPTGGMGYNTAIEDAVNIGWKLAAVIKGQAAPDLVASYEAERRPVAIRNTTFALRFADSVGLYVPSPAIQDAGPAGDAARARAGAYLGSHAAREFTIPGFTFGARYDGSPVIVDDRTPVPPDAPSVYVPTAKPGGRAPHAWLADGRSLFDAFGFDWTLLCVHPSDPTVAAMRGEARQRGIDLEVVDISNEPVAMDLYEGAFTLVRPDQIVAWRGDHASADDARCVFDIVTAHAGARTVADVA
ncbi:FAD-dependent oxidoreductase [Mesobacterium pallidum]|uniref:FAD-dependent oxidoreductase n=1 Tax=Mesobacterium pallidum TaxID=2872037 RepID=UPI001EE1FEEF|nr:FAD-dependent oxidoreductase [Mesobacterium pallidum]